MSFCEELSGLSKSVARDAHTQGQTRACPIKKSSPIYKLDPKLEKGLLCVGRRLRNAPIPTETKHSLYPAKEPSYLDSDCPILCYIRTFWLGACSFAHSRKVLDSWSKSHIEKNSNVSIVEGDKHWQKPKRWQISQPTE